MGRNQNRNNRSVSRKLTGHATQSNKKRDTGLPSFFKHRKSNNVTALPDDGAMEIDSRSVSNHLISQTEGGDVDASSAAIEEQDDFLLTKASRDLTLSGKRDSSTKAFMKDVKNVIENSDVILQVLDARDPLGCRSRQTEIVALSAGKKVVLILNKADLVPSGNLQGWLRYLRNDFPTLAFKASTQQQRGNLKQGSAKLSKVASTSSEGKDTTAPTFGSEAAGASALLQLMKNYARSSAKGSNLKQQLTVGVVGPPNVGKSSVINSLLRTRACAVASTPGWTKVVQGVMLEKGIRLLDCPGVVVTGQEMNNQSEGAKLNNAWSVLRNTIKVELIEDPITPIQALLSRVDAAQLTKLYNIEGGFNEGDAHDFLLRVALMRGKLAKGGVPDLEGAARIVLHDWNIGRISYYTTVPTVHPSTQTAQPSASSGPSDFNATGASLVEGFGEAFDLKGLLGEADAEAFGHNTGGLATGAGLIEARERRVATEEEPVAIEEDDDDKSIEKGSLQVNSLEADESTTSSAMLGKRSRDQIDPDSDIDSDHEAEVEEESSSIVDQRDLEEERKVMSPSSKTEYNDRKQHKAEMIPKRRRDLLTVFSEQELENMAERRSDVRKAAKKKKKRIQRSEAGLVDVWQKGLDLKSSTAEGPTEEVVQTSAKERKGLFDVSISDQKVRQGDEGNNEEEEL